MTATLDNTAPARSRIDWSRAVRARNDGTPNDGTPIAAAPYRGRYPRTGGLACVRGDVAEDFLGLNRETYDALRATTSAIVHCAPLTSFGRKPEQYEAINFRGTERVIEFATRGPAAPIPLLYVSTACVCGERRGVFGEEDLELGQRLGSPYEESK